MKNTRNICIVWALIAAVFVMGCCIGLLVERHAKDQAALQANEICRNAAQEAHDAFQAYWNTGDPAQYDRGTDCLAVFVETYPRTTREGTNYNAVLPAVHGARSRLCSLDGNLTEKEMDFVLDGLALLAEDHGSITGAVYLELFSRGQGLWYETT